MLAIGIVAVTALYLGLGAMFAIAFLSGGIGRIDEAARSSGWSFRVMIAPGVVLLWPCLFSKWVRAAKGSKP